MGVLRNNPRPYFYFLDRAHLLVTQHTFIWSWSIIWLLIIRTFAAVKIHFSAMTAPPPPPCKWCIKTCQGKALSGATWPPKTLLWRSRPTNGRPHSDNHAIHTDNQAGVYKQFSLTNTYIFVHIHIEDILNMNVIVVVCNHTLVFTWDTFWSHRHDTVLVIFPFLICIAGVGYWKKLYSKWKARNHQIIQLSFGLNECSLTDNYASMVS